jgi:hypothetical protein
MGYKYISPSITNKEPNDPELLSRQTRAIQTQKAARVTKRLYKWIFGQNPIRAGY